MNETDESTDEHEEYDTNKTAAEDVPILEQIQVDQVFKFV